jgi:hypothetical protein
MQMRDCYNYEVVTGNTVYYAIGKSPQATTTNAWLNLWVRQRKSKGTPNSPV